MTTRTLPSPQARAFVACRKITNDPQTGEIVITGPVPILDGSGELRHQTTRGSGAQPAGSVPLR